MGGRAVMAGRMDVALVLEAAADTVDRDTGDRGRPDWRPVRRLWARRATAAVVERWAGVTLAAEIACAFEVRAVEVRNVGPDTHRIREGATLYQLHGVQPIGRGGALLLCRGRAEREAPQW